MRKRNNFLYDNRFEQASPQEALYFYDNFVFYFLGSSNEIVLFIYGPDIGSVHGEQKSVEKGGQAFAKRHPTG